MANELTLIDTTRVSRSSSLRMSLPKRVADKLEIGPDDIIGFYLDGDGSVLIRRLS